MSIPTTTEELCLEEIDTVADILARREISALELTDALLARIDRLEPSLRAYSYLAHDQARMQAKASDARRAENRARGRLDGIPLAIKDIYDFAGWPTEAGMSAMKGNVAQADATVVSRLKEAGAVIVGKVHTTEGVYTEHTSPFSAPINPWDPDRWVGVSSSGSGVAPAAGLCFGALGSDTGGSIRMPSASNGVTGIKPTWGRVSRAGAFELAATLDHVGPMCRSARDSGILLSAIAGSDPKDPTASSLAVPDMTRTELRSLEGIRIGIDASWSYTDVSDDVREAHRAAEKTLASLGVEIVEIDLPTADVAITDWFSVCAPQTARAHSEIYPRFKDSYGPALTELIERGLSMTAVDYDQVIQRRLDFKGRMEAAIAGVDSVLIPAMSFIAPPVARMVRMDEATTAGVHRFTVPFTMSQLPTVTFPAGFTKTDSGNDFPVALQLVGGPFREQLVVDIVDLFQKATPWNKRSPSL